MYCFIECRKEDLKVKLLTMTAKNMETITHMASRSYSNEGYTAGCARVRKERSSKCKFY